MRILLAGATGPSGSRVLQRLIQRSNYEVVAISRNPEKQTQALLQQGVKSVLGADLQFNRQPIADAMQKEHFDMFFYTSGSAEGSSDEECTAIDRDAPIDIANLCQKHKTSLFLIGSMGVDTPDDKRIPQYLVHYLHMKKQADDHIIKLGQNAENPLRYVIFRPGYLINDPPTGKIVVSDQLDVFGDGSVTRDDVAEVVVQAIDLREQLDKHVLTFLNGEKDIRDALLEEGKK
jgi:uncharacterized protein YbjT (DUF2867 family)